MLRPLLFYRANGPHPDAHIKTFGQAVWWSITTITTVGYGDLTPLNPTGRVIAALLMIGEISLVGSITATLASWIVQRVADEDTATQAATAAQIDELQAEIRLLTNEVWAHRWARRRSSTHTSRVGGCQFSHSPRDSIGHRRAHPGYTLNLQRSGLTQSGRMSVTDMPCSACRRPATSERWHAPGSRSTQRRAVTESLGSFATIAPRSNASRISRV